MSKKTKLLIYITAITMLAAISVGTIILHFSLPAEASNAIFEFIHTDKGFLIIFVPATVLLLAFVYKFILFMHRKRIQDAAFKVDVKNDETNIEYAVGRFLKTQQKNVNKAAAKSVYAAVQSTENLKNTSAVVHDALKEHNKFIDYATEKTVGESKKSVKKLRKEAKPLADKISAAEKYRKK